MRMGDPVYWLEYDRPVTGAATVFIRTGTYLSGQYDRFCHSDESGGVWVRKCNVYFSQREEAECSAIGWAVRLVANFKYVTVVVKKPDGSVLYWHNATDPVPAPTKDE